MTDTELTLLEKRLGFALPRAYRDIMRSFPDELRTWPPPPGGTDNQGIQDFLLNVDDILNAQNAAKKRLRRKLPRHSFVFGRTGENYWLIQADQPDPPVMLVIEELVLDGPANLSEHLERIRQRHKDAWEKAERRKAAAGSIDMTPEALIAEGRRMARPAVLLAEEGTEIAGFWGGTGVVPPPEGQWEHRVSFDAALLPQNPRGLKGVISVYLCTEDNERFEEVAATHDSNAALPAQTDGQKAFARRIDCLPPLQALLKFGGPAIQDWLAANSADPNFDVNPRSFGAESRAALRAYDNLLREEHPFYSNGDCLAMLGGWTWAFMWCYDSDEGYPWQLFEKPLIVLTVHPDEPWAEVFDDGDEFLTFSRIT